MQNTRTHNFRFAEKLPWSSLRAKRSNLLFDCFIGKEIASSPRLESRGDSQRRKEGLSKNHFIWVVAFAAIFTTAASFDQTKRKLGKYDCTHFEFLSTVDSKIFDVVDSAHGIAYIAKDGRYNIEIGPDIFLFDGDTLYSYIWENNQLIIEKPNSSDPTASEISFVMKLDEWYDSKSLKENNRFKLRKKKGLEGDIPDSMILAIDAKSADFEMIEYFDINGDLNRIMILEQQADSVCNESRFEPVFPDSVEKVRI